MARLRRGAVTVVALVVLFLGAAAHAEQRYVVRPGDTLFALAQRFDTTVAALRGANRLGSDVLRVGQVLAVPGGQRGGYHTTIVRAGETLADVARRVGRTPATLTSANPGLASGELALGAAISVPPGDGVTEEVGPGDTLASLAARVGTSTGALAQLNDLSSDAVLRPGQSVLVPPAATGAEAAPSGGMGGAGPAPTVVAVAAPADPATVRERLRRMQDADLRAAVARLTAVSFQELDFRAPVQGRVSSRFGWRALSVNGNHFHAGVDLAVALGTPVHAARDGVVVKAGWGGTYGNVVYLDHGDGTQTRYAHLSRIEVRVGQRLRQGDVLGLAGSTGASTGPHVHFELRFDGRAVDPLEYLRGTASR